MTLEKFPVPISFSNLISGYSTTGKSDSAMGAITALIIVSFLFTSKEKGEKGGERGRKGRRGRKG